MWEKNMKKYKNDARDCIYVYKKILFRFSASLKVISVDY